MLIDIEISDKSFGNKLLYKDLKLEIQAGEKIGLIGRNGTGKSTLIQLINGQDKDYDGEIIIKKGVELVYSRQEHHNFDHKTVLEYILGDLPEYSRLSHIIDTYPETMGSNQQKLQIFSDALDKFNQLGYYQVEDELKQAFINYQIDSNKIHQCLGSLSGGEKRMVELIKVERSRADIALIDEPTNHMDFIAKEAFLKWLTSTKEAVMVITHDRDVLSVVDRIVEIRNTHCYSFKGNYEDYLRINSNQVTNQLNEYELTMRQIVNLENDVIRFRRLKEKARDPGTIHRFKSQELKALKVIKELKTIEKPSFWIDQQSVTAMNDKITQSYERHKAPNIRLTTRTKTVSATNRCLMRINKLSLGYGATPLFKDLTFNVNEGERIRLHGRNGVGKSTIIKAIMSQLIGTQLAAKCFSGTIEIEQVIKVGLYEQEINQAYLNLTLYEVIEALLREKQMPISDQKIKQLMGDFLFHPMGDAHIKVRTLSGGQKARIQLIGMLINDPQLLILDEPTNHLDLPSIEELENAMSDYHGAIIYISHDSFFAQKIGGSTILLEDK